MKGKTASPNQTYLVIHKDSQRHVYVLSIEPRPERVGRVFVAFGTQGKKEKGRTREAAMCNLARSALGCSSEVPDSEFQIRGMLF